MEKFKTFRKYEELMAYIEELDNDDKTKSLSYDSLFYPTNKSMDCGFGVVFDEESKHIFDKICFSYSYTYKNIFSGFAGVLALFGYGEEKILKLCAMDINSCGGTIFYGINAKGKSKDTNTLFSHTLHEKCGNKSTITNNCEEGREIVIKCIDDVRKAFGIKPQDEIYDEKSGIRIVGDLLKDGYITAPIKKNNLMAR